jgi:ribosomal protein L32
MISKGETQVETAQSGMSTKRRRRSISSREHMRKSQLSLTKEQLKDNGMTKCQTCGDVRYLHLRDTCPNSCEVKK